MTARAAARAMPQPWSGCSTCASPELGRRSSPTPAEGADPDHPGTEPTGARRPQQPQQPHTAGDGRGRSRPRRRSQPHGCPRRGPRRHGAAAARGDDAGEPRRWRHAGRAAVALGVATIIAGLTMTGITQAAQGVPLWVPTRPPYAPMTATWRRRRPRQQSDPPRGPADRGHGHARSRRRRQRVPISARQHRRRRRGDGVDEQGLLLGRHRWQARRRGRPRPRQRQGGDQPRSAADRHLDGLLVAGGEAPTAPSSRSARSRRPAGQVRACSCGCPVRPGPGPSSSGSPS